MLGLPPTAGDRRVRPLGAAIALLLALQLVVVATDRSSTDDADRDGLARVALGAVADLDQLDTTDTTAPTLAPVDPATVTTLAPFDAPVTADSAPPAPSAGGPGTGAPPATTATTAAPAPNEGQGPSPTSGSGCGPTIRKSDGSPWVCTMADDFDGSTIDRRIWSPMLTKTTNFSPSRRDCFTDNPNTIQVHDGALHLLTIPAGGQFLCESNGERNHFMADHHSGMVTTLGKWSQMFGRFEVRAKLPGIRVKGSSSSFWLWPDNPFKYGTWPVSGEIDFMEWYSSYPELIIPYIHYVPPNLSGATAYDCKVPDVQNWHTYAVEWDEQAIRIWVDNWLCIDHRIQAVGLIQPAPFDQPFSLSLTQALGAKGNEVQPGVTPMPLVTVVDYVRVWR